MTLSQAGYLYAVLDEPEAAAKFFERAIPLLEQLVSADPNYVDNRRYLALANYRFGVLKQLLGDASSSEHIEVCVTFRRELAKDSSNVGRQRELLVALGRAGKHDEAAALAGKLLVEVKTPDIELLLDVARAYAQCSASVAADEPAAEAFRVQAIDAIAQAVKAGHKDKVYLATEPDFVPLREREDFRALAAKP